jgi:hypothetical protein
MGLFNHHEAQDAHTMVYSDDYPRDNVTHELLAGAAGFEAMRMYEHHREHEGKDEHHRAGKEVVAGFAAAEVDKHFEKHGYEHLDQEKTKQAAQEQADYLYQQRYGQ